MTLDKRLLRLETKAPDKGDALADVAFAAWCEALDALSALPEGPERDAFRTKFEQASGGALQGEVRK